jgi:hypothetical protein
MSIKLTLVVFFCPLLIVISEFIRLIRTLSFRRMDANLEIGDYFLSTFNIFKLISLVIVSLKLVLWYLGPKSHI